MPAYILALYQWKKNLPPERIAFHVNALRALSQCVEGLQQSTVEPCYNAGQNPWHHAGIFLFQSKPHLEAWGPHPEHQRLSREMLPDLEHLEYGFITT